MSAHELGLYTLAHELKMTVGELSEKLTLSEYFGWVEWFERGRKEAESAANQKPKGNGINLLDPSAGNMARVDAYNSVGNRGQTK